MKRTSYFLPALLCMILSLAVNPVKTFAEETAEAKNFRDVLLNEILKVPDGGGYYTGRKEKEELTQNAWEGMDTAVTITEEGVTVDMDKARPSFCSTACYMIMLKALYEWDTEGRISKEAWLNLKPYTVADRDFPIQKDGVGCWGRGNSNGPGTAVLIAQLGAGESTYIGLRDSYASEEEYLAAWDQVETGDFVKLFWNENIGGDSEADIWEAGHMVVFLQKVEAYNEAGERDDVIFYWSSNGSGYMPDKGYGVGKAPLSKIIRAIATRITDPAAFDNAKDMKPDNVDLWLYAIMDQHLATEEEMLTAITGEVPDFEFTVRPAYGSSEIYTKEELEEAANLALSQFESFGGCELHSLRYAGDSCNTEENLAWMNELDEGEDAVQVVEFLSDFHTSAENSGVFEPDKEYVDYQWWLARTEGGEWKLLTWGY